MISRAINSRQKDCNAYIQRDIGSSWLIVNSFKLELVEGVQLRTPRARPLKKMICEFVSHVECREGLDGSDPP